MTRIGIKSSVKNLEKFPVHNAKNIAQNFLIVFVAEYSNRKKPKIFHSPMTSKAMFTSKSISI